MVSMQLGPKQFSIVAIDKNELKLKMLVFIIQVEKQIKKTGHKKDVS